MANYYVSPSGSDSANGSSGSPWKTITKAANTAQAGDTVRVRAGTYKEVVTAKNPNVTYVADDPDNRPILDGNYHPGLMSTPELTKSTTIPMANSSAYFGLTNKDALFRLKANGSTLDGFIVQNSAGTGILVDADNVTVRNCSTFWTFDTGIHCNPAKPIGGLLIEDNEVLYASVKIFEPLRRQYTSCNPTDQCVSGGIKFGNVTGLILRRNRVGYGFGEGINIGKGNRATAANPILIEDNVVYDCNHSHIYVNATQHVIIRRNIVYCGGAWLNTWGNGPPAGIRLKDEKYQLLDFVEVYNNLIVNTGLPLAIGERYTKASSFYCGYNTIVGGPDAQISNNPAIAVKKGTSTGGGEQKGIVENNMVDYSMMSSPLAVINNVLGTSGVAFRNNAWSSQPPPAARSSTDVVGTLNLVNPRAVLRTDNYLTRADDTYAKCKTTNNFNPANYMPTKESPVIGAASDRTRFNGVTPPAFSTDLFGNARTDQNRNSNRHWDIGAIEYGGAVTPPPVDDDVSAAFTTDVAAGIAPLTVTFTDKSTTGGAAVINSREWDWGDDSSAATPLTTISHAYIEAGTYTPRLTVRDTTRNLSSVKVGTPIVVSSPPIGEGLGIFDVVRAKTPIGGGDMTVTFDLNGHAPELVIFLFCRTGAAYITGTNAHLSIGMATLESQRCHVLNSDDTADPTSGHAYSTSQAVMARLENGEVKGLGRVTSFGANKVVVNVDSTFGVFLVTAIGIGGPQYRATVGDFMLGADGETTTLATDGAPEWYLFAGGGVAAMETVESTADLSFGMADASTQTGFSWRDVSGRDNGTHIKASISKTAALRTPLNKAYGELVDAVHGRVTVRGGKDIRRRMLYGALEMPGATTAAVRQFMSPTSTGEQTYSFGFKPVGAIMLVSMLDALDAHTPGAKASGFAITAVDPAGTHCASVSSEYGAAATNSHNRLSDSLYVLNGSGGAALAGTVTLVDDGIKINWTTVQSTPCAFNVTAFRAPAALAGPIPMFSADTTTPADGTVTFTDLSNANGSPITAWEWDFGDGGSSTERNPTHTYIDYGEYTVSLTVTNANGSETLERKKFITYAARGGATWLGLYEPRTITNYTRNKLYGNDPDHPLSGYMEFELDLDSVLIDAIPEADDMTAVSGKARIYADTANKKLIVLWPDDTITELGA